MKTISQTGDESIIEQHDPKFSRNFFFQKHYHDFLGHTYYICYEQSENLLNLQIVQCKLCGSPEYVAKWGFPDCSKSNQRIHICSNLQIAQVSNLQIPPLGDLQIQPVNPNLLVQNSKILEIICP